MSQHTPSRYQQAIYDAFEHSGESLLVEAVAGSGKTYTLVELANIMQRAFPRQRAAFVAFNRSIAEELGRRITAGNVACMTLHSAGWSAWRRAGGIEWTPQLDSGKTGKIMRELLTWAEAKRCGDTTRRLVGYAKGAGIVPDADKFPWMPTNEFSRHLEGLIGDTEENWQGLIEHYGLDEEECDIALVRKVLARSIELAQETCDFDDMLYMPVVCAVPFDRYDVVLVDEAQDLSGIQHEMIERMAATPIPEVFGSTIPTALNEFRKGRVIAVGDRNQAIYGFRGAHADSMDRLRERFGMRELPLSISYRCPQAVVRHAQQWVPQIEYADTAEFGYVGREGTDWTRQAEIALEGISKWRGLSDFLPGDAVLCRLTRPLVEAAFTLIRGRVACRVLGRDIGKGLTDLARKLGKRVLDQEIAQKGFRRAFSDQMERYQAREAERLRRREQYAAIGHLGDRMDTLRVFLDELAEPASVDALVREIESLFADNGQAGGMVTLSTIHKFKGMESDRVFVLDAGETLPCKWARQAWELKQEGHLAYVAATRAKRELRYITSADLRRV